MTSFYEVLGRSPAAATAAASTSANLTVSVLSQAAAAASSQALAEAPSSTDDGSEVNIFTQIIIAISVIPVQLVIVTIVLGIHRLVHRRPPRHLHFRLDSASPTQESPPYLQPKAELEDDRARRHELHGEHAVRELDGEGEILQIADETDSIVLPLHGTQMISEMPEPHDLSSEMPHQTRTELMGGEIAQELECPSRGREDSVDVQNLQGLEYPICAGSESVVSESVQELASPVRARELPIRMGKAQDRAAPGHDLLTDTTHSDPSQSHLMLTQQQVAETSTSAATD